MKGKDPSSGEPVCCAGCSVAQLADGGCAPGPYKIQVSPPGSDPMNFQVNIALVPSDCKRRWTVLHLLHRDSAPGVLTALNYSVRHAPTVSSTGIPGIVDGNEPTSRLTTREQQVLELLSEGLSSNTISKRLGISLTTVRNHIQHIQAKLGVHSQSEAVAYAYRHNLV
jgi:DNA-binding CsgD family transcriptional regulator